MDKFFAYVRTLECCICHGGEWDMDKGQWRNTVSHVLKRGSTRRNMHYDNCVAMCLKCHRAFEVEKPSERMRFQELAKKVTSDFACLSSENWWNVVKTLQGEL